jgi:hypothetical protein
MYIRIMNGNPIPILQKEQKNEIFTAIQAVGLDPRDFDLDDFDGSADQIQAV